MRIFIIFAFALFLALPEVSLANTKDSKDTVSQQIFGKKKHKGYRKKKGFMWGLFKKNDCGCPKH